MGALRLKIDANSLSQATEDLMDEISDFIFQKSQENIVEKGITDRGTLLQSGKVIKQGSFGRAIVYDVVHADVVEFGRDAGTRPPITPIVEWVRRKLGINDTKSATSVAWAISTTIQKSGNAPRPYLGPAIESAKLKYGT